MKKEQLGCIYEAYDLGQYSYDEMRKAEKAVLMRANIEFSVLCEDVLSQAQLNPQINMNL